MGNVLGATVAAVLTLAGAPATPAAAGVPATVDAAAGVTATVNAGGTALNARAGASTVDRVVAALPHGSRVAVVCQVYGQAISGTAGYTAYWDRLSGGGYVADAFVRWSPARPAVPWCGSAGATVPVASTASGRLHLRAAPTAGAASAGTVASGTRFTVSCQAWGQRVAGTVRTSSAWNRLAGGQYVADAFVAWQPSLPTLPWCGQRPPTIPPAGAAAFLARVAEPARAGRRQYQVPASVTIAQAILESGWARSTLTRRDHSFFGIKCFGHPGTNALGCRSYPTYECGGGGCYRTSAQFRAYRDAAGSFADHGYFLRVNPRYRPAFAHVNNPDRFAQEIHKAGYATSPTYATNLIKIMRQYNLYRYDR